MASPPRGLLRAQPAPDTRIARLGFDQVWVVDFEFHAPPGERPEPICLVARELHTGRLLRVERSNMGDAAPFPGNASTLFISYYASAELGCYLSLGWPMPSHVLDLYAEFRVHTNGRTVPCGSGLLGAMAYFGMPAIDALEKQDMRDLATRGGPYNLGERRALMDYCQSDVDALAELLVVMLPHIDLPRAMLRGRYMQAAAQMEHRGTPIDVETFDKLKGGWCGIQDALIAEIDQDFNVYDGRTFKMCRWADYLTRHDIAWPHLDTGNLSMSDDTFRQMSRRYPQLEPLRELRHCLSQMRLSNLAVGVDGRNRCMLSAFRSKTGRNQPSNTRSIFGPAVWLRGLIKPGGGRALAYVDYSQQEFGIAAALSGDPAMQEAYRSGDPYLAFAQQAGAAPAGATKISHHAVREQFKVAVLAVQYGMGGRSLGAALNQPEAKARELLELHRLMYPKFWAWSAAAVDRAMLCGELHTVFGWRIHVDDSVSIRTIRNFPMQGNGADILRLACCLAVERGVEVCMPVHDALLIEAPAQDVDDAVAMCRAAMTEASEIVLGGFPLLTGVEQLVKHPDRFADPRGAKMWRTVTRLLEYP